MAQSRPPPSAIAQQAKLEKTKDDDAFSEIDPALAAQPQRSDSILVSTDNARRRVIVRVHALCDRGLV
jgi:hypothetical protein